jgi:hypothetical protein
MTPMLGIHVEGERRLIGSGSYNFPFFVLMALLMAFDNIDASACMALEFARPEYLAKVPQGIVTI